MWLSKNFSSLWVARPMRTPPETYWYSHGSSCTGASAEALGDEGRGEETYRSFRTAALAASQQSSWHGSSSTCWSLQWEPAWRNRWQSSFRRPWYRLVDQPAEEPIPRMAKQPPDKPPARIELIGSSFLLMAENVQSKPEYIKPQIAKLPTESNQNAIQQREEGKLPQTSPLAGQKRKPRKRRDTYLPEWVHDSWQPKSCRTYEFPWGNYEYPWRHATWHHPSNLGEAQGSKFEKRQNT